jgi:uncharacterized protein DUF4232
MKTDMNQHMWRLAAGILASLLLGACASTGGTRSGAGGADPVAPANGTPALASSSASPGGNTPPAAARRARPPCQPRALDLGYGPALSPMTGEHGDFYALINRGARACTLAGYLDIRLYDANGAPLPFRYRHGHSPYVTAAAPVTVTLRPGASAWVLVAKYRCDVGTDRDARSIRITVPGAQHAVLTGRASSRDVGVSALSYCRGGTNDPGQTVAVSPVEPTLQAAVRG